MSRPQVIFCEVCNCFPCQCGTGNRDLDPITVSPVSPQYPIGEAPTNRERSINQSAMSRIFIDMDGVVVVDFDAYKTELGLTGDEIKNREPKGLTGWCNVRRVDFRNTTKRKCIEGVCRGKPNTS